MIEAGELGRIIFGCGNFGGLGSSPALRNKGDGAGTALALLDEARAAGLTRFDTANTYGGGVSETLLGDWLARQDRAFRGRVEIATKVGNPNGCPPGERPLSRGQVARHLEQSLRRLGVERIDLYYLHEFDPSTPLLETLEAMDQALGEGKIASFGVSNATADDLRAVLSIAGGALRRAFTHVQNEFNRLQTSDLAEVIPLVQAEGLRYSAFSPLSGGLLTGKYAYGRPPAAGTRLADAPVLYGHRLTAESFAAIAELERRAAARGWTVAGAALRFVLDTPGIDSLIIAPRSATQFSGYGLPAP
jgi:aryl-alcohol dehydrogenase-like predicted oxidoreductase